MSMVTFMAMVLGCLSILFLSSSALGQQESLKDLFTEVEPTVYPHLLDPRLYPDYTRRPHRVPTWETFDNTPQFTGIRHLPDASFKNWELGKVVWPGISILSSPHLSQLLDVLKQNDCYLFDIGGYGPGSLWTGGGFGQAEVPEETLKLMEEKLGERFLGFDIGEQDGRYLFVSRAGQSPFRRDKFDQFLQIYRYFAKVANDQGNRMNTLMVYHYWHYPIKEGNVLLAGAETQNKVTSSSIHYAFLRGAGKQYGIHWFGNASVFNTWHHKAYHGETERYGPTKGNSLNLMKRLLYTHYLYNCVILGFEGSLTNKDGTLSPLGILQRDAVKFAQTHPQPGVMHTPVALLLDHFSGWMPARTWTTAYKVWNYIPYKAGDYLTHNVLSTLYPGYEDCAWYYDERGTVADTPYGDMTDVLLADVPLWMLKQYGVVVAAGKLNVDQELRDKVRQYVQDGGHFIISATNARCLWPEWQIGDAQRFPGGTSIGWSDGSNTKEPHDFELCSIAPPQSAIVLARCQGMPVAIQVPMGAGSVTALLSPCALNADPLASGDLAHHNWNQPLAQPYVLLDHARRILDRVFVSQQLFSVGEGLGFITCRKGKGNYTLGIFNNSLEARPFKIVSHCGAVREIRELDLGTPIRDTVGYWPHEFQDNDGGRSDDRWICGGDIRLFSVQVDEENVRVLERFQPASRPRDRILALRKIDDLQEEILRLPTFFQYFDGVKLDWKYLLRRDREQIERDRPWLERQKVRILVDFSSGLNHFPDLTLLNANKNHYKQSVAMIDNVLDKMESLGAKDAIICPHMLPEVGVSTEEARGMLIDGIRDLCRRADERDITLHIKYLRSRPMAHSAHEALSLIEEIGAKNLFLALNTSVDGDLKTVFPVVGNKLGLVLLSAPGTETPEMQLPLHYGGIDLQALQSLHVPLILDADYRNFDEIYLDVKALSKHLDKES